MSHAESTTQLPQKRPRVSHSDRGQIGRGSKIFTLEHQKKFLKLYASGEHSIRTAAEKIGFKRSTIFYQAERSERFAAALEKARARAMNGLGDKMHEFGIGKDSPTHPAQLTAMFGTLKAFQPERWRENVKVGLTAEGALGDFLTGLGSALAAAAQKATLPQPEEQTPLPALEHQNGGG